MEAYGADSATHCERLMVKFEHGKRREALWPFVEPTKGVHCEGSGAFRACRLTAFQLVTIGLGEPPDNMCGRHIWQECKVIIQLCHLQNVSAKCRPTYTAAQLHSRLRHRVISHGTGGVADRSESTAKFLV